MFLRFLHKRIFQLPDSDAAAAYVSFSAWRFFPLCQLPVFDAAKEGFRIQDSVVRILKKTRRQKPVVGFAAARAKTQASETGSWGKTKKEPQH
jgi:hypothetical protein